MAPLDNRYWVPTPVRPNNPHPLQFLPIEFPQPQVAQQDIDSDSYEDSEEYLGYPSYDDYIDSYVWPDLLPFDTFDYLNELQIPESENIFGNLFATLFWTWKISYWNFQFLKMKTFLGIYLVIIFFQMIGTSIGMMNWKTIHMGFMDFCLAMDSSHLKKNMMKYLAHFYQIPISQIIFKFLFKFYNKFPFLHVWDVTI